MIKTKIDRETRAARFTDEERDRRRKRAEALRTVIRTSVLNDVVAATAPGHCAQTVHEAIQAIATARLWYRHPTQRKLIDRIDRIYGPRLRIRLDMCVDAARQFIRSATRTMLGGDEPTELGYFIMFPSETSAVDIQTIYRTLAEVPLDGFGPVVKACENAISMCGTMRNDAAPRSLHDYATRLRTLLNSEISRRAWALAGLDPDTDVALGVPQHHAAAWMADVGLAAPVAQTDKVSSETPGDST